MTEVGQIQQLLRDFESKEFGLKEVRAKYIGISPGPSFSQHERHVLTPQAIGHMKAAETEMHEAWLKFIGAAENLRQDERTPPRPTKGGSHDDGTA